MKTRLRHRTHQTASAPCRRLPPCVARARVLASPERCQSRATRPRPSLVVPDSRAVDTNHTTRGVDVHSLIHQHRPHRLFQCSAAAAPPVPRPRPVGRLPPRRGSQPLPSSPPAPSARGGGPMHLSRLDDLEPFTTLDGSTIRELAGRPGRPRATRASPRPPSRPPAAPPRTSTAHGGALLLHRRPRTPAGRRRRARRRAGDSRGPAGADPPGGRRRRRAARAALLRAGLLRRHGARRRRVTLMGARFLLALAALAGRRALAVAAPASRGDHRHRRPEARHVRRPALSVRRHPPRPARRRLGRDEQPLAGRRARPLAEPPRAAGVQPLVSFMHSRTDRRSLPTPERLLYEFRRFRAASRGSATSRPGTRPTTAASPPAIARRSSPPTGASSAASAGPAESWPPSCSTCPTWSAGCAPSAASAGRAAVLGAAQLHRRQPLPHGLDQAAAGRDAHGQDLAHRGRRHRRAAHEGKVGFDESPRHSARALRWVFRRLVPLSPRVQRVYIYHWNITPARELGLGADRPARRPRPGLPHRAARDRARGRPPCRRGG